MISPVPPVPGQLSRRELVPGITLGGASLHQHRAVSPKPNVVLILADNLSYGDLGCYGGPIRTPHIDSLARQGVRFTDAYAATMCSPSRSMLLTGRYAERSGLPSVIWRFETDRGLPLSEVTLGNMFQSGGYRTACFGKWHLGHGPTFLPVNRGFHEFLGIPYSLDMPPCPLMDGAQVVEKEVNRETLPSKIAQRAVQFIEKHHKEPFFLYLPHTAPHPPLTASRRFRGHSPAGIYGDVVEEMDAGIGSVLATLKKHALDRNTLVLFTSDNGPYGHLGSTGGLRGASYHTFEGAVRVPFLARWPGSIAAGRTCRQVASLMDIAPTLVHLCGLRHPGISFDGVDISRALTQPNAVVERDPLLYFDFNYNVQCARSGKYKLHLSRHDEVCLFGPPLPYLREIRARIRGGNVVNLPLRPPELYNLEIDPGECYDVADRNSDIVESIKTKVERLIAGLPQPVQTAYAETMKRDTFPQEPGRLPRLRQPD